MILVIGPIVIVLALIAILAPRLFTVLWRLAVFLLVLGLLYVVDGQQAHPLFPHSYTKSDGVR